MRRIVEIRAICALVYGIVAAYLRVSCAGIRVYRTYE